MAWLIVHVVTFAAVNAFLVFVWLVTGGDRDLLDLAKTEPVDAVRNGFWPGWVMASWAPLVVIHAALWLGSILTGHRRRTRRRLARHAHEQRQRELEPREPRHRLTDTVREAAGAQARQMDEWIRTMTRQWSSQAGKPGKPWAIFGPCHGDDSTDGTTAVDGHAPAAADAAPPAAAATAAAPASARHWVAVMFTDICHSTELAEEVGDDAWLAMLAGHRKLVRECLAANGGTEVGTQGDGFLVRFETPENAVSCAAAIQRRVAASRAAEAAGTNNGTLTPQVRIGIHAGEAIADEGDLVGRVINLAYRVAAVAEGDEVLVTEPVADRIPPGTVLADRGLQPLKGIAQPRHLLSVEWHATTTAPPPGARLDAPVPTTVVLPD